MDFLNQKNFNPPDRFLKSLDFNWLRIEKSEAVMRAFREIPENYNQNEPFPVEQGG